MQAISLSTRLKVTNTGEETLYNVMVTDPKISNIFGIDSTLAPDDMTTGYGVYVLKPWDIRKGVVHNKAFAKGEDSDGLPAKDMDVEWKYIPKIDLDKEFVKWIDNGNWKVDAGDKFVYSFKVTNTGEETLYNVMVTDPKISNIFGIDSTLAPDDMTTGYGVYVLKPWDIRKGVVHNKAFAKGEDSDGLPAKDVAVEWKYIPKIDLDKEFVKWIDNGNWKVDAGDKFVYSFKVTNTGEETLYNVMVTDPKISNIFGIDSTLAPDDMTTGYGVYVLKPWDIRKGVVHNKAFAKGEDSDGLPAKDVAVEWKYIPKIDLDKEFVKWIDNGNWKVDAGDKFIYKYTVTNTGEETLYDVTVWDNKIPFIIGIDPTLDSGEMTMGFGSYTLKHKDIRKGFVRNKAFAKGEDADGLPAKDMDVVWKGIPKIDLDKEFKRWIDKNDNGKMDKGDKFVYKYKVTNTGEEDLENVTLWDNKIGWINLSDTELDPGEMTMTTARYTLKHKDIRKGFVHNKAFAKAEDEYGLPAKDMDSVWKDIPRLPDIEAPNIKACVTENVEQDVVLLLITDASFSMSESSGVDVDGDMMADSRLELANAAWSEMLAAWDNSSSNVKAVLVAQFSHDGNINVPFLYRFAPGFFPPSTSGFNNGVIASNNSMWTTIAGAEFYLDGIMADGFTNYAQAVSIAMGAYGTGPGVSFDKQYAYFMTDGGNNYGELPNVTYQAGDELLAWKEFGTLPFNPDPRLVVGDDYSNSQTWHDFLNNNNFDQAFALGIAGNPDPQAWGLDNIIRPMSDDELIIVDDNNLGDLGDILVDTVDTVDQKMVMGTLDDYVDFDGADPTYTITFDGIDYTWEGGEILQGGVEFVNNGLPSNGSILHLNPDNTAGASDPLAGIFTFEFDSNEANYSKFTYTPGEEGPNVPMFSYTIEDEYGQTATGDLSFDVHEVEERDGEIIDECTCDELIALEIFASDEPLIYLGGPEDNALKLQFDLTPGDIFDGGDGEDSLDFISSTIVGQDTIDGVRNIEIFNFLSDVSVASISANDVVNMTDSDNILKIFGQPGSEPLINLTGGGWAPGAGVGVYESGAATVQVQDTTVHIVV